MFYHLDLNKNRGRMYCRAMGLWDVSMAERFRQDMRDVHDWAVATNATLTVLTDLTDLPIHPQDVLPIVGEGANMVRDIRLNRYAMIVPSPLMKMQVRRIDPFPQRVFFDDALTAARWLGWEDFRPVCAHALTA